MADSGFSGVSGRSTSLTGIGPSRIAGRRSGMMTASSSPDDEPLLRVPRQQRFIDVDGMSYDLGAPRGTYLDMFA